MIALAFLALMIGSIAQKGASVLTQTYIALDVDLGPTDFDPEAFSKRASSKPIKKALRAVFPQVRKRAQRRKLYGLISSEAPFELRRMIRNDLQLIGGTRRIWFSASDDVDLIVKERLGSSARLEARQSADIVLDWIKKLTAEGAVQQRFNWRFFTSGDSREPELAGIFGALAGSALSLAVCFLLSFPVGAMAAIYLEEFAPKNRWSELVEVNINNLAAVPSIIYGLLGLAVFLNTFGLPRSSPLVGGMVLSLMTLPTIIIAARASLRAVPPSIREAALGVGASPVQATFHHVAPLALPGMLTGAILGMARALGETAPLLMIGMVAFVVDIPTSVLEPATALPVQIFLWADSPERAFLAKTSAAIIVLLVFLVLMNLAAILLRKKFEQRF